MMKTRPGIPGGIFFLPVGTSCAVTSQRNVCSRDLREIWSSELRSVLAIPDRSWPPNSIFLSDLYGRDVSLQCRGQYCEK